MIAESDRHDGDLSYTSLTYAQLQALLDVGIGQCFVSSCCQVSLQPSTVVLRDVFLPFFADCGKPCEEEEACDEDSFGEIEADLNCQGLRLQIAVNVGIRTWVEAENESFGDWSTSQGIEKDIKAVSFDGFCVFLLPITLSHNDVFSSFRLQEFGMLLSPDNVEQRNAQSLASLVEHSSQS